MHTQHLLCIDNAPDNVLDSAQVRKAEARKLAPTAGSIGGSWPVAPSSTVAPSIRGPAAPSSPSAGSRLSIGGPVASISPSWFLSSKQAEGIERLATATPAAAGLLSAKQVKGVEGLFAPSATPAIVVVRWFPASTTTPSTTSNDTDANTTTASNNIQFLHGIPIRHRRLLSVEKLLPDSRQFVHLLV